MILQEDPTDHHPEERKITNLLVCQSRDVQKISNAYYYVKSFWKDEPRTAIPDKFPLSVAGMKA